MCEEKLPSEKRSQFPEKFRNIKSEFLFLTVNIPSEGLVSALNSIVPLQALLQILKSFL